MPVKDLCRKHGFSEASYCLWRSKFGGMSVPEVKRLKDPGVVQVKLTVPDNVNCPEGTL
jgi:putative transposase